MRLIFATVLMVFIFTIPAASANNNSTETIITVDSTNLRFSPSTVTIDEGDTVRFFWDGQFLPHNAVENNEVFDSGDTTTEEDYSFQFIMGLNGTFDYYCEPHQSLGMIGQIIVNPSPVIENNSTEDNQSEVIESDGDSKLPFLSMPSLSIALLAAALIRRE